MLWMHPDKCPSLDGYNSGFFSIFGRCVVLTFFKNVVRDLTIINFRRC